MSAPTVYSIDSSGGFTDGSSVTTASNISTDIEMDDAIENDAASSEVQINIAEIAFIDGGKDAGMHRMNYALAQIEEMKNVPLNDEDAETLKQLWNRCQEIIRKYS